MFEYIARRLLLVIPTLLGIVTLSFFVIQLAPGSPIEQKIQQIRFASGESGASSAANVSMSSATQQGVSQEVIEALKRQYGFDKPIHIRYLIWLKSALTFEFGESFKYEEPVIDVIVSKFPVSIQFGVFSFVLSYLISIPLGIAMARREGHAFDAIATFTLSVLYSIPGFMLGILLIVLLAGGSYMDLFPTGGLYSDLYEDLGFFEKIWDRIHHAILPLLCFTIGSFTTLSNLTRNNMLEVIKKDYVRTARAKGLEERVVMMKHALRNALIPVVTGIGGFLGIFFAGSLLIERVFQLDGIGLLGFNSILARDYNVVMALVFIQSLLLLVGNIIGDIVYVLVDPRIDFS